MVRIRSANLKDKKWVSQFITEHWGADFVVAHGKIYYPNTLPGFIAVQKKEKVGLVTYRIEKKSCEIITLDSTRQSIGVGTALINTVKKVAQKSSCRRLWLITTNDNLNALRFYQKRGFSLVAVHRNALKLSRKLKPQISMIGDNGIPLRDEIELEMILN